MNAEDTATKMWYDKVINPDPFHAISNIIAINSGHINELDKVARELTTLMMYYFHNPNEIHKAKLIYVDKDLLPSILNTDNEIFTRKMGLPCMFINQDFKFKNKLIKGIMILDTKAEFDNMDPNEKMKLIMENPDVTFNTLTIICTHINMDKTELNTSSEEYSIFRIGEVVDNGIVPKDLKDHVSNIVCNILDFMNNDTETIEVNTINVTREEQAKAIRKGKMPTPNKVYIRPKQEHRSYYQKFNEEINGLHYGHSFLVRGFWRHLRSDKWKNSRGKSIWIRCFIKGKGILISKKYQLED